MRGYFYLIFITILIFFTGCKSETKEETRTVFRYNEPSGVTSLDPVFSRNQANIWAASQLFNGLVQLDYELNVKPAIAKDWDISSDGKQYTFYLRNDIYFHDDEAFPKNKGRKVVAKDFVFSLNRLIDNSINSPGNWVMNSVARNNDNSLDVSAINDTTLIINLNQPFPPFLSLLSMVYCSVIPKEAIEHHGSNFRSNPVGTGPFRFKYWKDGVKLVFVKNENYFEYENENQLPYIDAIAINFIVDRQSAFLEFIKGNLDFLSGIDASYKDELLTTTGQLQTKYHDEFSMLSMNFLNTEYLGILMDTAILEKSSPLNLKYIRQAINYGFDRKQMITHLRNNIGTPAHAGFVPIGMPGFYDNEGGYYYNPDKARKLLAKAGFPGGDGLKPITVHTNPAYLDICRFIQFELNKIGIQIEIDVEPPATLREMMAQGNAPFFRGSWIADYPDAENYLALFYSKNKSPAGPNYTQFSNKKYDKLYEKALTENCVDKRIKLYHKMNNIIIEEAPVIPLYYDESVRFISKRVSGLYNNPLNHLSLKRLKIKH